MPTHRVDNFAQGEVDRGIAELAATQYGVLSRAQAQQHGVSSRMIETRIASGRWQRLYHGVYRIAGTPASWFQDVFAAWLRCGDQALASHWAAAALWEFPRFGRGKPEFVVPRSAPGARVGIVVHRVRVAVPPEDRDRRFDIPVTGAVRTIFDLAAVASIELVEGALEDVLRRKLATLTRFRWQASRHSARAGIIALRRLIAARASAWAPTENEFELELLSVLRAGGIEGMIPQFEVFHRGEFVARVDVAIPELRIAIEADSYSHHAGLKAWARDHTRGNKLRAAGWLPFPVTWVDLKERPDELVREIHDMTRWRNGSIGPPQG